MAVPRTVCALWNCPSARCVVLEAEVLHAQPCVPCLVSPRARGNQAEPRADTGRMWDVEAQGLGEGLWETGGRKIPSVKGARERAKFLESGPCKERADDMKK